MRQIIRGKAYDTETATEIARGDYGEDGEAVGSQACWILFRTQGGAFFEASSDHDGAPNPIKPLARAAAKQWLQSHAPRLVEKYFGEAPEARARGASQTSGNAMTDAEIRGRLLTHFYGLRNSNDGWVPTTEIILSPEQVSRHAVANVCQQLAEAGYIQWNPFNPQIDQLAIGRAKITGRGVDVVTGARGTTLDIRFPNRREHDVPSPPTSVTAESPQHLRK